MFFYQGCGGCCEANEKNIYIYLYELTQEENTFYNFSQSPPLECKQLRDAGIVIRFQQPAQRNLQKHRMWKNNEFFFLFV